MVGWEVPGHDRRRSDRGHRLLEHVQGRLEDIDIRACRPETLDDRRRRHHEDRSRGHRRTMGTVA
jgi:hypothetical protein